MGDGTITVEREFSAPCELVWSLLADTNRYDRAMGQPPARYQWQQIDGTRSLVGQMVQAGMHMQWVELPYEWVEGRLMHSRRVFLRGPAAEGGLRVHVEPKPGGCRARVQAFGTPKSLLLKTLGPLIRAGLRRKMSAYLDEVEAALAEPDDVDAGTPALVQARRLLERRDGVTVSGGVTPVDAAELKLRAERLRRRGCDPQVLERLTQSLSSRPDDEVAQMRPFELAQVWGLPRRNVLRSFLEATEAGLVDLSWQINCPVCKVAAGVVRSLGEVEREVHCDACNISYDLDFGANVEAVFRCNPAVRPVEPTVYCAASPVFRPHVFAQLQARAEQSRTQSVPLAATAIHVRTLSGHRPADLELQAVPGKLVVTIAPGEVRLHAEGQAEPGGETELQLINEDEQDAYVLIERAGWSADTVSGTVVASMPEFLDLFATEAPAAGLELSIQRLTFLFSDLTGSTALYERVGDARAFAIVQEHFAMMEEQIARCGGAVVKTMGDAVMATFEVPEAAIEAATAVLKASQQRHSELEIGIKLGVHEGACLAVRANERLDFFGTTVNVAARLQGQARTSEVVLTGELAQNPAVAARLTGVPVRRFRANLKGIAAEQELEGYDLGESGQT